MSVNAEECTLLTDFNWGPLKPFLPSTIEEIISAGENVTTWNNKHVRILGKITKEKSTDESTIVWKLRDCTLMDDNKCLLLNMNEIIGYVTQGVFLLFGELIYSGNTPLSLNVISLCPFNELECKYYYKVLKMMNPYLPSNSEEEIK